MGENLINLYSNYRNQLIKKIEENKTKIPFSKLLIFYLKSPYYIKLIIMVTLSSSSAFLLYNIGFIIIQSKAKNEILSLITAFQNPVDFSTVSVFYHSFVYLLLLFFTVLPFIGVYIFYNWAYSSVRENYEKKKITLRSKKSLSRLLFIVSVVIFIAFLYFLIFVIPLIPFVMLYSSKDSSIIELLFKYFISNTLDDAKFSVIDYENFYLEILYSLTLPNLIILLLSILAYYLWYKTKTKKSIILKGGIHFINFIVFLIIIMLLSTHTFYQWGNFGKNLSQFNIDYIRIEYSMNNLMYEVEGTRVFQKENYIVLRTSCNVIKYIISDQMVVENLTTKPICDTISQ